MESFRLAKKNQMWSRRDFQERWHWVTGSKGEIQVHWGGISIWSIYMATAASGISAVDRKSGSGSEVTVNLEGGGAGCPGRKERRGLKDGEGAQDFHGTQTGCASRWGYSEERVRNWGTLVPPLSMFLSTNQLLQLKITLAHDKT